MKNLTTDRRRIPWTPAAIVAFVITAAATICAR
jgi:hypothetical protein